LARRFKNGNLQQGVPHAGVRYPIYPPASGFRPGRQTRTGTLTGTPSNSSLLIEKNIARIFRHINILEYKSPEDYFSVYDFFKVLSYVFLYASLNKTSLEVDFTPLGRHR
jgi:hypothetical protein